LFPPHQRERAKEVEMNLGTSQQISETLAVPSGPVAVLAPRPVYLTVEQFSERNPAFTPPALRNLIFKAEPRQSSRGEIPGNGLAEAGAVIRLGRRVLLDESKFLAWVAQAGSAK
jgi:hypothetical protein